MVVETGMTARLFDLNIEKILEAWAESHAVRELIANAMDEQTLSQTRDIAISQADDDAWIIRDYRSSDAVGRAHPRSQHHRDRERQ